MKENGLISHVLSFKSGKRVQKNPENEFQGFWFVVSKKINCPKVLAVKRQLRDLLQLR